MFRLFRPLIAVIATSALAACGATATPDPTAVDKQDAVDVSVGFDSATPGTDAAAAADTKAADAAATDAALQDSGAADTSAKDSGPADSGASDTTAKDTVAKDAATTDAATPDSGPADVGPADTGGADAADGGGGPTVAGCGPGLIWLDGKCATTTAMLRAGDGDTATGGTVTLHLVPPNNLLANPGAETGDTSGWTATDGGDPWSVVSGVDAPFGGRFFRGSYGWGYLAQTINLVSAGISATDLDAGIPLHMGVHGVGWGYPSSAGKDDRVRLDITYQDAMGASLGTWTSGEVTLPIGAWGAAAQDTSSYPVGTRSIAFSIGSIDGEYWKGNYAASIDGAALSVGALDVRISNADGSWSAWQPYACNITGWALTAGTGLKTVQVEFRDGSGKSLGIVTDTVVAQ